jgi:lysophospholipase L1-like esterase
MRRIVALSAFVFCAISGAAYAAAGQPYYLALGDSLARGVQPLPDGTLVNTNQGFVDGVYAYYRLRHPQLQLAKLGCSGESTTTMIAGGKCSYPLGSQLAQAVDFLHSHRVALITITIGGDDVLGCISPAGIDPDPTCVERGLFAIGNNLPQIISALRAAAGPKVPIVGANYFDPILAAWVLLPGGQTLALDSLQVTLGLNALLESLYSNAGIPVADLARAFRITDFANVPGFNVPLNVFLELTWTWIGAPPPRGPDVHPNTAGYAVIAATFIRTIGPI